MAKFLAAFNVHTAIAAAPFLVGLYVARRWRDHRPAGAHGSIPRASATQ
jgi:hypothetical protein